MTRLTSLGTLHHHVTGASLSDEDDRSSDYGQQRGHTVMHQEQEINPVCVTITNWPRVRLHTFAIKNTSKVIYASNMQRILRVRT